MSDAVAFLNEYCDFSNPHWVWILTGMSRSKDNANADYHDYLQRLVLTKPEDILECYKRIRQEAFHADTTYRMYVSLNARDAVKTVFNFQHKLLEIGYGLSKGQDDSLQLAKKIGSLWKSELAQTNNRATKRVLLDIDTQDPTKIDKVSAFLEILHPVVRAKRRTPAGIHVVIDACDTRDFMASCKQHEIPIDLQRDSLVFVERW